MGYVGEQKREYQKQWMSARRQAWIESHGPCQSCGSSENLEVDHKDPRTKQYEPAQIWSRKAEDREIELAKCQVLCAPCHKRKTLTEDSFRHPRGSSTVNAKLTESVVKKIRLAYDSGGVTYQKLADEYGVHKTTIRRAVVGELWQSVE